MPEIRANAMQFDDRLATVLRHRAAGERAARTQFRQLLDLLGSRRTLRDEKLLASAWLRLGALGEMIPASERAAMVRDPAMRFRNPELAAHLAEDEPEVAAAALSRAQLTGDDWEALIPRLPVRARGFLRLRRDLPRETSALLETLGIHDRGLPHPDAREPDTRADEAGASVRKITPIRPPSPPPEAANDGPLELDDEMIEEDTEIGALVKRIEAFRKARSTPSEQHDAPRLPLGELAPDNNRAPLAGFAFTANASGRIDWAAHDIAPMVIGTRLERTSPDHAPLVNAPLVNAPLVNAMRFRQPIRGALVRMSGAPRIAGEWIVDAAPRFTQPDGRFYGYAGMFRRKPAAMDVDAQSEQSSEADRLRQLLHELKTPVNAIQGFAEVIQQQLFGPTPHEYRALAANIAGDSARMMAGFDELDRLAKLETGALDIELGESDFAAIVAQLVGQLQPVLKPRTAEFSYAPEQIRAVSLDHNDAETLAWRVLATLAGATGAGEHSVLTLSEDGPMARLSAELPVSLSTAGDIFAATAKPSKGALSAGMFGAGFSLRLARAEARAAGGDLTRVDDWLVLTLPLLTNAASEPSQKSGGNMV